MAVGTRFSGMVSYELPGQPILLTDTRRRDLFPAPPASISVSVGSFVVRSGSPSTQPLQVTVADGGSGFACAEPCDEISFGISLPSSTGPPVRALQFSFSDPTGQALSGLSIPTQPPDLAILSGTFLIGGSPVLGPNFLVTGTVDSIVLVPEPGTLFLFGVGLAVLLKLRGRRAD